MVICRPVAVSQRLTDQFVPTLASATEPPVAINLPSGEQAETGERASTGSWWRVLPVDGSSRKIVRSTWADSTLSSGEKSREPQVQKRPSISRSNLPVVGSHNRRVTLHVASIFPL